MIEFVRVTIGGENHYTQETELREVRRHGSVPLGLIEIVRVVTDASGTEVYYTVPS